MVKTVMLLTPAKKSNGFMDWVWRGGIFKRLPFILGWSLTGKTLFALDRMEYLEELLNEVLIQ